MRWAGVMLAVVSVFGVVGLALWVIARLNCRSLAKEPGGCPACRR